MTTLRLAARLAAGVGTFAAVVLAVAYWPHVWYWIEVHTGTVNEPGPYYGFFSGFGSDLGEITIIGGLIAVYRKHNCEVHRCWRLGRHTTAAGHAVCRRHHPEGAPTYTDVTKAHQAAKRGTL